MLPDTSRYFDTPEVQIRRRGTWRLRGLGGVPCCTCFQQGLTWWRSESAGARLPGPLWFDSGNITSGQVNRAEAIHQGPQQCHIKNPKDRQIGQRQTCSLRVCTDWTNCSCERRPLSDVSLFPLEVSARLAAHGTFG